MSDSEDDIFSMSTVPYDYSDSSSIYDKETQALEDISREHFPSNISENKVKPDNCSESELYDGPTQPLKLNVKPTTAVDQGSISSNHRRIQIKQERLSPVESDLYDGPTQPLQFGTTSSAENLYDGPTQPLTIKAGSIEATSRRECISPAEDDFYDGPTQPLVLKSTPVTVRRKPTSPDKESLYDGPTQPLVLKSSITSPKPLNLDDDSDRDTIPASPVFLEDSLSEEINITAETTPVVKDNPNVSLIATKHDKLQQTPKSKPSERNNASFLVDSPILDSSSGQSDPVIDNEANRASPVIYDSPTQPLKILSPANLDRDRSSTSSAGREHAQINLEDCDTIPLSPIKYLCYSRKDSPKNQKRNTSQTSDMDIEEDTDDETQVIHFHEPSDEKGISSVSTVAVESQKSGDDSDRDTLPCSPVGRTESFEEVPSTQSKEAPGTLKMSDTLTALKPMDNDWDSVVPDSCPLSPDLFSASPSHSVSVPNQSPSSKKGVDCTDGLESKSSRSDRTIEMDQETLAPASPVFDFDDSEADETQIISSSTRESPEMMIAETPFVPETPFVARSPSVSGTPIVAETPFITNGPDLTRKRKIIRRSTQVPNNDDGLHQLLTPSKMIVEDNAASSETTGDSDGEEFELSFASHYSALPRAGSSSGSSSEPFVGFEHDDVLETSHRLQEIQEVIKIIPTESKEPVQVKLPLDTPTVPEPTPGPSGAIVTKSPDLPPPRRSSRRLVPNTRRMPDEIQLTPQIQVPKRRPGRPPKVKVEVESSEESDASRKAISVSLPVPEPAPESEGEAQTRRGRARASRQKPNSLAGPALDSSIVNKRTRHTVKKEPKDDGVPDDGDQLTSAAAAPRRRARRSVNNNNADTSSIGSSSPSVETSRRRKRALAGQVRVMFTVIDDEGERANVQSLGGRVVTTFKDCSVLVTDRIRRTVKFLCCVGLGLPIVGPQWLAKCRSSGKFVDPWLHLLRDKEGEKKFNFQLSASLKTASETPLLAGWIFHATPSVMPPPDEVQEIVEACGGFYEEDSEDKSVEKKIVISCIEDKKTWNQWKRRGVTLVDKEAILTGVLQQVFEPDKYKLTA